MSELIDVVASGTIDVTGTITCGLATAAEDVGSSTGTAGTAVGTSDTATAGTAELDTTMFARSGA